VARRSGLVEGLQHRIDLVLGASSLVRAGQLTKCRGIKGPVYPGQIPRVWFVPSVLTGPKRPVKVRNRTNEHRLNQGRLFVTLGFRGLHRGLLACAAAARHARRGGFGFAAEEDGHTGPGVIGGMSR
jgi:hypothetical protein